MSDLCQVYLSAGRLTYALPAWGGFVSVEQTNRINALLKRCYRYGYVDKVHCMSDLLNSVDLALFDKMHSKAHCLYPLLHPVRNQLEHLRSRGHDFTLPSCTKDLYKRSFVMRCCLTLCNNHTIVFVLLCYHTTHSFFPCKFYNVSPYFYMFYFVYYHICVCHVSINITYF